MFDQRRQRRTQPRGVSREICTDGILPEVVRSLAVAARWVFWALAHKVPGPVEEIQTAGRTGKQAPSVNRQHHEHEKVEDSGSKTLGAKRLFWQRIVGLSSWCGVEPKEGELRNDLSGLSEPAR